MTLDGQELRLLGFALRSRLERGLPRLLTNALPVFAAGSLVAFRLVATKRSVSTAWMTSSLCSSESSQGSGGTSSLIRSCVSTTSVDAARG